MTNTVSYNDELGIWACDCGAKSGRDGHTRFLSRHPKLCLARRAFTHQLAQTTRHLDDLETNRELDDTIRGGRVGTA